MNLARWTHIAARPVRGAPALFLDRDGTMIENVPYLADPAGIVAIPGTSPTLRAFRAAGFAIVVVTNQSGVARGLVSPERYRAVDAAMRELLGPGLIDASYACPFHPDGQGTYAIRHDWRKPAGGMLLAAAAALQLDLAGSLMVGDSLSDMAAGAAAGVGQVVHVLTGHGARERAAVESWATGRASPRVSYADSIADLVPDQVTA